jgi:hypothetical protein
MDATIYSSAGKLHRHPFKVRALHRSLGGLTMRSRCCYARVLTFVAVLLLSTQASAVPVQWTVASGGNGHFYDLILVSGTWATARNAAALAGGHLVTITSLAENQFLVNTFNAATNAFVWIGASDAESEGATEGNWEWVVGPEAGLQFWQGGPPAAGGTAFGGNFENWGPVEPNNAGNIPGEDVAALNLGGLSAGGTANGEWGDTAATTTFAGYIIEVSTPAAVPEPSAVTMLLLGIPVVALRLWRRAAA